jgi:hypothetical protein
MVQLRLFHWPIAFEQLRLLQRPIHWFTDNVSPPLFPELQESLNETMASDLAPVTGMAPARIE